MPATAPRSALRPLLAAAALLLAVLGVLAGATPAAAHSSLTGSEPAQGSVAASAPTTVTLGFSEQVALDEDSIKVLAPDGERVDTGEIQDLCSPGRVRYGVPLRADLPDGTYTVAWRAVSADSHPISGAFTFSVGAPSETSVVLPERQVGAGPVAAAYDAARFAAYGGLVLLVGGAGFVLLCWRGAAGRRPVQRLVVAGWSTLAAATVVLLLLRYPFTTGGGLADAFDLGGLRSVLDTRTGTALLARLLLLGVAALFVGALFGPFSRRLAAGGERAERGGSTGLAGFTGLLLGGSLTAVGLAATWAAAEHASAGRQIAVAIPVAAAHLLAVALWLGGLAALLVALRSGAPVPGAAARRFSTVATLCVLTLVATGGYQAWRQVGGWSALTGTEYGRLLLGKLALLAVLLVAAWYSRRWSRRLGAPRAEERPEDVDQELTAPAVGAASGEPDPERRAQLARQAAAVASARRRRQRDADPERAGLRRTVLVETVIAVALLAVTTLLTGTEPARTEAASRDVGGPAVPDRPVSLSVPFDTGGPDGRGTARIDLDPGRVGPNTLHVRTDVDAEEVRVAFTLPSRDVGPLSVDPEPFGEGAEARRHWTAEDVRLPLPGEWRIAVTVRTSDVDQVTETTDVRIG
ncbi:copper resistance CopC/CopD family protein [Streptomyces alkaliterrae]|uniref:Copper resistance protein CopC n=1 Tax=Streptomyces alkaliterrae TaxID=2213162 RepID=A0A5P0YRQ3_9ACTN|nr:copper resistance protein CopC [Streptomyces alkaliterrae]MBB1253401.1 copper resistance protein CopC [Streptomyces alkaliterrae]MBB1260014.1 copper resistance protein CopC [Streptomyces alkaliterrae]MQS02122.1 hypothetical protein [Streptomyces alkaliterrae]